MLKVALPIALVVLGALVWVSVSVGIRIGRAREAALRGGIDPDLHQKLVRFTSDTVGGTSLDSDYWASLSPAFVRRGEELLSQYRRSIGAGR